MDTTLALDFGYDYGMATGTMGPITGRDLIMDFPGSATIRVHLDRQRYRLGRTSANELPFSTDHKLSRGISFSSGPPNGSTMQIGVVETVPV